MVYRYYFQTSCPLIFRPNLSRYTGRWLPRTREKKNHVHWNNGLLRVSKMIYDEAIALAYNSNNFTIMVSDSNFRLTRECRVKEILLCTIEHRNNPEDKDAAVTCFVSRASDAINGSSIQLEQLTIALNGEELLQAVPYLCRSLADLVDVEILISHLSIYWDDMLVSPMHHWVNTEAFTEITTPVQGKVSTKPSGKKKKSINCAHPALGWPGVESTLTRLPSLRKLTLVTACHLDHAEWLEQVSQSFREGGRRMQETGEILMMREQVTTYRLMRENVKEKQSA